MIIKYTTEYFRLFIIMSRTSSATPSFRKQKDQHGLEGWKLSCEEWPSNHKAFVKLMPPFTRLPRVGEWSRTPLGGEVDVFIQRGERLNPGPSRTPSCLAAHSV
ncbi:hypothetical protein J6590_012302 [Homalodisca vitripennis]|nr:hypothetical protein J6590_012302 [Homalodisca vitripennis]